MLPNPATVLILCTGNSARSILAEAMFNSASDGRFQAYSAGSTPTGAPNPFAIELLKDQGIDTGFARSKSWDEFAAPGAPELDLVITVCDNAASETCPIWPSAPISAHWGLPDPAAVECSDEDKRAAFAQTWTQLGARLAALMALPLEALTTDELADHLSQIGQMP
ncbi:MAG: arsenate reductase ArsC [Mangrovicoccus sp.]|nr:arsenate reductase ArsC [Mangrovicoccus sp.]